MSHLDRATEPHGLATTGGRVSTTGVGGFVLGGGNGWLDRKMGLACDNLVAAEVVTADGRVLTASAEAHPELFWALHGGGGNFGVVTSLTLRLHPLGPVTVALLLWEPEEAGRVLRAYRDFVDGGLGRRRRRLGVPDRAGGGLRARGHGRAAGARRSCSSSPGPRRRGAAALAPMLGLGHRAEMVAEMPYAELQCLLDDPPGFRNYWSAEYLGALPDAAIDAFVAAADGMIVPSPSQHALFPGGGAVARETADWPVPWRQRALVRASVRPVDRPGRRRARPAVGAGRAGGGGALGDRGGLSQLHRRRGRGPGAWRGFGAEAYRRLAGVKRDVRSGQRVPPEPQHPPGLIV